MCKIKEPIYWSTLYIYLRIYIKKYLSRRWVAEVRGNVKWFNNDKGYGFIEYLDGEDIFVHYSAIKQKGYKSLSEGKLVEFELVRTPKGLQAINVVTVEKYTV